MTSQIGNNFGFPIAASILKEHIKKLETAEAARVAAGKSPSNTNEAESWDIENWNNLNSYVDLFNKLLAQIKLQVEEPYYQVIFPEWGSFYLASDLYDQHLLLIRQYKKAVVTSEVRNDELLLNRSPQLISFVRIRHEVMVPYYSSPGYYDDPKAFPGPKYVLVDRRRLVYYQMLYEVLSNKGIILLTPKQADDFGLDGQEKAWPSDFQLFEPRHSH